MYAFAPKDPQKGNIKVIEKHSNLNIFFFVELNYFKSLLALQKAIPDIFLPKKV